MKVILSRKGFDSSNGGCASPILPDGTLLSMPIPSNDDVRFCDLEYNNISYFDLIKELKPEFTRRHCHLDPDIRPEIRKNPVKEWKPAFGQIGSAQSTLENAGVSPGDLILFFGWFRHIVKTEKGYRYVTRKMNEDFYQYADLQVIYGYMQIGEIIKDSEKIKNYIWHPHANETRICKKTNALYIPSEKLSFNENMPGYGTFDFRIDRVLTKKYSMRGTWNENVFYSPEKVYGNRKNSAKNGGLYYAGIWQELIINESEELTEWAKKIVE